MQVRSAMLAVHELISYGAIIFARYSFDFRILRELRQLTKDRAFARAAFGKRGINFLGAEALFFIFPQKRNQHFAGFRVIGHFPFLQKRIAEIESNSQFLLYMILNFNQFVKSYFLPIISERILRLIFCIALK